MLGVQGIKPSFLYKLNVQVVTNGYTKFLKISDAEVEQPEKKRESAANYSMNQKEEELEIKMNMVELSIS